MWNRFRAQLLFFSLYLGILAVYLYYIFSSYSYFSAADLSFTLVFFTVLILTLLYFVFLIKAKIITDHKLLVLFSIFFLFFNVYGCALYTTYVYYGITEFRFILGYAMLFIFIILHLIILFVSVRAKNYSIFLLTLYWVYYQAVPFAGIWHDSPYRNVLGLTCLLYGGSESFILTELNPNPMCMNITITYMNIKHSFYLFDSSIIKIVISIVFFIVSAYFAYKLAEERFQYFTSGSKRH